MENKQAISKLFNKYLAGQTNSEETGRLLNYFGTDQGNQHLKELVDERFDEGIEVDPELLAKLEPLTNRVEQKLNSFIYSSPTAKTIWRPAYTIVAVAASILLAIGTLLFFDQTERNHLNQNVAIDADPGTSKAILTLADGRTINLDKTSSGKLADEAGVRITKALDGSITYQAIDSHASPELRNMISTPRGGQYQIILPDGSKVWLNSTSSLKYPVSFAKQKQRIVELVGEAYFEVAPNKEVAFIVKTATQDVEVLGTHFNVNNYQDSGQTITTLAEGSVKVLAGRHSEILKPGQQTLVVGSIVKVQQADMETALSWKDGNMVFKSEPLENIMKDVERWYNVEVVYEGQVRKRIFSGGISRNSKLSVLLNILKDSGVNFEMRETPQGKALLIKP